MVSITITINASGVTVVELEGDEITSSKELVDLRNLIDKLHAVLALPAVPAGHDPDIGEPV